MSKGSSMAALDALKGWTAAQKHVVVASYLGWTLDAFDFFLMVFVIRDVAHAFGVGKDDVAWALTLTLMLRPVGAFVFGRLADRFGRRPVLMADVALYSLLGFATAFAPNLIVFLAIRAAFGPDRGGGPTAAVGVAAQSAPKIGFVFEQTLGHVTHAHNLQAVLADDRAGVAMGNGVLVGEPVHPIVEAQKTRALLDLVEPLREPAAGNLRDPFDEVAMRVLGVVHGHERPQGEPNC